MRESCIWRHFLGFYLKIHESKYSQASLQNFGWDYFRQHSSLNSPQIFRTETTWNWNHLSLQKPIPLSFYFILVSDTRTQSVPQTRLSYCVCPLHPHVLHEQVTTDTGALSLLCLECMQFFISQLRILDQIIIIWNPQIVAIIY